MTNRMRSHALRTAITLGMALLAMIMIYPFVWMVSGSFKVLSELYAVPPTLFPAQPTLANYATVFEKMDVLGNMYKNSVIVAVSVTAIQIVTCSTAAFAFAKLRFPGRNVIFMVFLASMMIPGQMTIIPLYTIIKNLRLMDSLFSLILLGSFNIFGIFLIRQFFLSVPQALNDAAKLDGCNPFKSYLYVHLPLARPVIAVVAILTFNGTWGDFFGPLIFLKSIENMTLPLGISIIQGVYSQQSPTVMIATLVVSIIPVLIVFLAGRKQLISGLTTTGMKL